MYLRSIEENASSGAVFTRGIKIAGSRQVGTLMEEPQSDGSVLVSAQVRGSGNNVYDVSVLFDPAHESVVDHYCSCPAHEKYPGMCKHAVAVAFLYGQRQPAAVPNSGGGNGGADATGRVRGERAPEASQAPQPHSSPQRRAQAMASARAERVPSLRTSSKIEQMVRSYADRSQLAARRAASRVQQPTGAEEPAELTCTIAKGADAYRSAYYNDDMWRLGLVISRGKASYVVKQIGGLVEAWRSGSMLSYGKKLAFVHRPSAFSDHANKLLETLAGIVDAQRSMYDAREMRDYYYGSGKLSTKTLPLLPAQLADILELELNRELVYEYEEESEGYTDRYGHWVHGTRTKRKATIPVTDGDPVLDVEIAPHEGGGGYDLHVEPHEAECIVGGGAHVYLVTPERAYRLSRGFAKELGPFCASVLPSSRALQIADASMPAFCAAVLTALRARTRLAEPAGLDKLLPPEAEFVFRIGAEDGRISCNASVSYGERTVGLFDDARKNGPVRDVGHEMAAQAIVREFFFLGSVETPSYDPNLRSYRGSSNGGADWDGPVFGGGQRVDLADPYFPEEDDAAYYALFSDGLAELADLGEVLLSEKLKHVSVRPSPSVRVEATLADGKLELKADSSELSNEELLAYLASYRKRQRYLRLADGDIVALDGAVQQVAELSESLGIADDELVAGTAELAPDKTLFVDAMLKRAGGVRFDRNEAFRKIVRDFETVADADIPVPAGLHAQMRPYQEEGFRWLCVLGGSGFGGILADDMGLGKTLQAIAYFCHKAEQGEELPALVVCPASLVYNWMAELARFAPGLSAAAVLGTKAQRRSMLAEAADRDVLVTSYDLLKRDVDLYGEQRFSTVMLDEAQYIKNASTKAAKSAKELQAKARFALTGTPIENRLSELWSIFDFLMPGALGAAEQFSRRFSTPIGNGDEACAKRLQALVGPFILRRLKEDVLTDLPEKNESVVYAQMEGEQKKLYQASASKLARSLTKQLPEEFQSSKLQVLAELTRLRQIACDPRLVFENYEGGSAKLDTCCELIGNAVDGGHSLLVFSQFTSMFALLEERLGKAGIAYLELTGSTSKEERMRLVKRFQAREVPVFLISLKAGGVGLNLTAADIVIHYDPWWNLAAQNQATDRAHRIGQEREVTVFKLIAKDTIEEKIVEMQEAKQGLADSVIGGEAVSAASITRDDILALLDAGN